MHLGTNIRRLREARGLTTQQLADLAGGMGQSNISKLEKDKVWVGKKPLQLIADALGVPIWQLFLDPAQDSPEAGAILTSPEDTTRRVQVLSYADAYSFVYSSPQHSGKSPRGQRKEANYVPVDAKYSPDVFSLLVTDDSMAPMFNRGQHLIFDPKRTPKPNSVVAVHYRDDNGDWVVPRLFHDRGQTPSGDPSFEAVPRNRAFRILRSEEEVDVLGVLVEQRVYFED